MRMPARPSKRAAMILEVLAGVRTPTQAAQDLGVTPSRYYLLEDMAAAALEVIACELQPRRGRRWHDGTPPRGQPEARECRHGNANAARQQALVRAAAGPSA